MKDNSISREILFVTTTSFSKRQLCKTDMQDKRNDLAHEEQLEEACWNGLVDEMLPEIMHFPFTQKLFVWQVEMRRCYLRIIMSIRPPVLEKQCTLDPFIFLCKEKMN
jgi:hypothetical protein